jgi:hypothetical protein
MGLHYTFPDGCFYQKITFPAVYKPTRGESDRYGFPSASLAHREAVAYLLCRAMD